MLKISDFYNQLNHLVCGKTVSNYCTYFLLNTTKNLVRGKKLGEKSKVILLNLVDFFNQLPLQILIIKRFSLFNFTRSLNFD